MTWKTTMTAWLLGKRIGVFDTTYVDWGPIKISEGIKFAKDILRLMDDIPDIAVMFKGKKEIEITHPELLEIYKEINEKENGLFIPRYNAQGISAPDVIAYSHFVISAAYTSTSAEALCARVKAIYYEPGNHDIGDKYIFNRMPNFVAHDYDELKRLTNYWLYEVTDGEFDEFLNKYVKDEFDPHMDAKGLTRLRSLLME